MGTYKTGDGQTEISLSVDINTLGLAASRAIVLLISDPSSAKAVAHSENATGDIAKKIIGTSNGLQNRRLSILTKVDLLDSDLEQRKAQYNNITANYVLSGGTDGSVTFNTPLKSVDAKYKTALIHQPIDLI
ncbi:hypothetical protein [Pedobacter rhodius]|uniref:Uncharacterized protein n=1 Tax=Pedobacter rhodius TaxID=3004098 RepID=A0ABT4KTB9_9SPHI|nr:hypothetical protein [Pedobacter sp. SJ11]MCZ4222168.1 hypothetical protein [Pedobacter sp. SJ11]